MLRKMCLLLCFMLMLNCYFPIVNAVSLNIETEDLSLDDRQALLKDLNFRPSSDSLGKTGITCFDIREDGTIAVGMSSGNDAKVYLFDSEGVYMWGYSFTPAQAYGVMFHRNSLIVYLCRYDMIVRFALDGTIADIQKVTNYNQLHNELAAVLEQTSKEVNGVQYMLERDIPIGSAYSRLVIVDATGARTLFYDATENHLVAQILMVVLSASFLVFVAWGAFKEHQEKEKEL